MHVTTCLSNAARVPQPKPHGHENGTVISRESSFLFRIDAATDPLRGAGCVGSPPVTSSQRPSAGRLREAATCLSINIVHHHHHHISTCKQRRNACIDVRRNEQRIHSRRYCLLMIPTVSTGNPYRKKASEVPQLKPHTHSMSVRLPSLQEFTAVDRFAGQRLCTTQAPFSTRRGPGCLGTGLFRTLKRPRRHRWPTSLSLPPSFFLLLRSPFCQKI